MTWSGRAGRLWSLLGFGTFPGDPEETRAFLQKRVSFYLLMCTVIWITIAIATRLAASNVPEIAKRVAAAPMLFSTPPAMALVLFAFWLYVRRGNRPMWLLTTLGALGTIKQTSFLAFAMTHTIATYRPDLAVTLATSFLIIARASLVPSTGLRTALIGIAAGVPLVVATYVLYTHSETPPFPTGTATVQIGLWAILGVLLSTTTSRVIYGLQLRVQEATRLGQYVIERKLGEGGMGIVYLARHAMLRRPTAVKVLQSPHAGMVSVARFEREVQLTCGLTHPNTIAIYDYGRTPDGLFYYAMEYLDGVDLERLVRETGPLPPARVVHILKQVAAALEEAHSGGLVHRDVKPSNIVLCKYGMQRDFAKVLDFGLVRQTEAPADPALSGVQALTGTPLYMSPEAINDAANVDGRTDLYALGAVAYYLLTGERVFDGKTIVQVCAAHLYSAVTPPSERLGKALPEALERIVLDCLAKDRDKRIPNARELVTRLEACGVELWATEDAKTWWNEFGPALEAKTTETSASQVALTVDLAGRRG